jgi:cytochrome oxidase Cu insertion factor (SCO1/SenC/PrrC family)
VHPRVEGRARRVPAALVVAVLTAATAAALPSGDVAGPLFEADPPRSFELPVIREAADFSVRDAESGALLRLADFRGRAVVLSLFYTTCPDGNACPLATATLKAAEREIERRGLADRVALLSVTFDEGRDSLEVLRAHRARAGAGPIWRFASPETAARREALLAGYDQRIARAPDGTIVHPLRVYLLDGAGRVRQIYSQSFLRPDVLLSDIETVLPPPALARPPSAPIGAEAVTGSPR